MPIFNFNNNSVEYTCTKSEQTFRVNYSGVYLIEAYGAQGATYKATGGKGGYASGKVSLKRGTTLYVYVGCVGSSCAIQGTYNDTGSGGGGASDVRLIGGAWNNSNGLLSRFIVAGGGGGGGPGAGRDGGYGGGLTGGEGKSTAFVRGAVFGKGANTGGQSGGGGGGWIGGNTSYGSQTIPKSCFQFYGGGGDGGSGYVYTNTSEIYQDYKVPPKYQMFDTVLTPNVNSGNGRVIITFNLNDVYDDYKCTNSNRASFITSFMLVSLITILSSK
jgi:hypothetical protein